MAANLVNADIWRLIFDFKGIFRNAHVDLDYAISSVTGTPPTDVDLVAYADSTFGPLFITLMTDACKYLQVRSQRLFPVGGRPIFQLNAAHAGIGSAGTNALPQQTSGLVSFYTDFAGHSNRGRKYIPFPDAGDDNNGSPSSSYVARLGTWADAYRVPATMTGAGGGSCLLTPVVFHKKTLAGTTIASRFARGNWATARRRGFYRPPRRNKIPV